MSIVGSICWNVCPEYLIIGKVFYLEVLQRIGFEDTSSEIAKVSYVCFQLYFIFSLTYNGCNHWIFREQSDVLINAYIMQ